VSRRLLAAVAFVALAALAACTSHSSSGASTGTSSKTGGTAYLLTSKSIAYLDPQRVYGGRTIWLLGRLAVRTLVQYGSDTSKLYPDLATDVGRTADRGKTWSFRLRTDATWQDGTPVTCADIKYGVSRTFANDVITTGPTYAIAWLDIPADPDGTSSYKGPYTKQGQAAFDRAIDCTPTSITFHLNQHIADFNQALTLPAFGAYKASLDRGAKSALTLFSDGPYQLQGTYEPNKGGTFVRNPTWNPRTDPAGFRMALPDRWVIEEKLAENVLYDRLLADRGPDRFAVTDRDVPAAMVPEVLNDAGLRARRSAFGGRVVEYLFPNFHSAATSRPAVRTALAEALDKQGWVVASGGDSLRTPADSLIPPGVPGHHDFNAFGVGTSGDPAKARKTLTDAGISVPVRIRVAYSSAPDSDAQASALKSALERDGVFAVTLHGVRTMFPAFVSDPGNAGRYDVSVASWYPDWESGTAVLPPLFDSRPNITKATLGRDFGGYEDPAFNAMVDGVNATTDAAARERSLEQLDEYAQGHGAYIPIALVKNLKLHGSGVKNYAEPFIYPDFGAIGVA
jgi:peptide/nickel transport system substrate-binding protein